MLNRSSPEENTIGGVLGLISTRRTAFVAGNNNEANTKHPNNTATNHGRATRPLKALVNTIIPSLFLCISCIFTDYHLSLDAQIDHLSPKHYLLY